MDHHHLLEATGIVVSGVLFYSLAYGWFASDDPRRRPLWMVTLRLVWGAIAVILMISRIETREGVFVDLGGPGAGASPVVIAGVAVAAGLAHRWAGGTERVRAHRGCSASPAGPCSRRSGRPISC
ncbi:MAG TPA: hypothetical protein VFR53_10500 [Methylomirabilota bacterium]|nr:hypothetical protein [Methylomirabilota bacterium]